MKTIDERRTFADRHEAGIELGKILEAKYKDRHALVLGIPRGGVVIAYELSHILHAELSVVITKKLPHPLQQELAIGAVAEDRSVFLTSLAEEVSADALKNILQTQEIEIENRVQLFRNGEPLPDMHNRIVIIADDGIATGSTIVSAIKLCREKNAAMVIVAAPVAATHYLPEINTLADEVMIAEQPEDFVAVGQVYDDFHHMTDDEVICVAA